VTILTSFFNFFYCNLLVPDNVFSLKFLMYLYLEPNLNEYNLRVIKYLHTKDSNIISGFSGFTKTLIRYNIESRR